MISATRRVANQGNAQNSTGPSSVAGKAVSRMNALKTGLYAKSLVIRGESREEFDELAGQFNDQYCPVTPQSRLLVDILIRQTWILRRLDRIESEHWDESFRRIDGRHGDKSNSTSQAFDLGSRTHDRIRRFADAAERSIIRTLNKLDKLTEYLPGAEAATSGLAEAAPAAVLLPQPVAPEALSPENGFVPSNTSEAAPLSLITGPEPAISAPARPDFAPEATDFAPELTDFAPEPPASPEKRCA